MKKDGGDNFAWDRMRRSDGNYAWDRMKKDNNFAWDRMKKGDNYNDEDDEDEVERELQEMEFDGVVGEAELPRRLYFKRNNGENAAQWERMS